MLLKSKLHLLIIKQKIRNQIYRGEKEAGARTGRSCEKIKEKKALQYFNDKEECILDFLAFVKYVSSIWIVPTPDLLHEMICFLFDFIGIKSMFFQSVLGKSWENIWIFFVKKLVGTLYRFPSKSKGRILDGLRVSSKKFSETFFL